MMRIAIILISTLLWTSRTMAQANEHRPLEIFILMGQSNMSGRGTIDAKFEKEGNDHVLMFTKNQEWLKAKHPLHFDKPRSVGVGPGLAFGIEMAKANPKVDIGLVPCAVGGTSIENWAPGAYDEASKTHPYDDAIARIKAAMAHGTVKGVIWHQGEANRSPQRSKDYLSKLSSLIESIRQLTGNPKLPFVMGELGRFRPAFVTFNKKLDSAAHLNNYTALASAKKLTHKGDSTHFDAISATELGKRMAAAMQKVQRKKK